jgi:hypothetical protein
VSEQPGREELLRWRASKPQNFFDAVPGLAASFELWMGPKFTPTFREKLSGFGAVVATEIEPAVQTVESSREFPRLHRYDELGQHVERIEFHPAHDDAARAAWASRILATPLNYEVPLSSRDCSFCCHTWAKGAKPAPLSALLGYDEPWSTARLRASRRNTYLGLWRQTLALLFAARNS